MKSLAELVLSFLCFWVLPDGFCGVPCELPPEYPPILLGLLPSLIAAASCGAPEIAAARMTAVSIEILRMVPPVLAARTSVRLALTPRTSISSADGALISGGQRKVDRRQVHRAMSAFDPKRTLAVRI